MTSERWTLWPAVDSCKTCPSLTRKRNGASWPRPRPWPWTTSPQVPTQVLGSIKIIVSRSYGCIQGPEGCKATEVSGPSTGVDPADDEATALAISSSSSSTSSTSSANAEDFSLEGRPFLGAVFEALGCSENDYVTLFALCLLHAIQDNKGQFRLILRGRPGRPPRPYPWSCSLPCCRHERSLAGVRQAGQGQFRVQGLVQRGPDGQADPDHLLGLPIR